MNDSPATIPISVMVFTLDEELNLPSCLSSLQWCEDVIVVDSFSTDTTLRIAEKEGASIFQHSFSGFGDQRNWALEHCEPVHPWVLILDADERIPDDLVQELRRVMEMDLSNVGAFRVRRRFHIWGRWLRHSSLYPTWVVRLVHRDRVRFLNRGHAETQEVNGEIRDLESDLIDENLKGIDAWFERQIRYASKDAEWELERDLQGVDWGGLFSTDALLRRAAIKHLGSNLPFRGLIYFFYSWVLRGGFLDGRDGLVFCSMRATYQRLVAIKKYDLKRRAESRRSE